MDRSETGSAGATMIERGSGSARLVPVWLDNLAALGWRVLAVAALLVSLWYLGSLLWTVTASIMVGIVISAVFAPLVLELRARGRSRNAAASIVWATAVVVIGGVLLALAIAFFPYVVEVVSRIVAGLQAIDAKVAELQLPSWFGTAVRDIIGVLRSSAAGATGGLVAAAAGAVTVGILATFLVFFFLRDGDKAWIWAFQELGDQKRERITRAGDDALARIGGYLRGTTILAGLIAITDLVFMLLLGVPLALPLAILAFLAGYIPYFGGAVVTGIILIITFAAVGPVQAFILLVLIGIRNVILGYGVRPSVYGRTVSIHPALVLLALPMGFELAGVVGLFAAVPVTAVLIAVSTAVVAIVEPDPRPQLPALVPAWLDRVAQFSWRILVGFALIALLVYVASIIPLVVVPVVLAIILAATLEPLVRVLIRRGSSRTRAAGIAVGGGIALLAVIMLLALGPLVDQAGAIADKVTDGARSVDSSASGALGLPSAAVISGTIHALNVIATVGSALASLAVIAILGALLTFYFLKDGGQLWGRLIGRVPTIVAPGVREAGTRAFDVLGGYMIGTAAISFVGAASQFVIMVVLGLPYALPVFVLSFFLCFIPYIGGFISTGIAFLIAVSVGSTADVVIMGVWTIVFNIVTGNIVSPLVYGKTVHIHPAIVLVAIPAGAAIAGIMGMFLVVPVLGVIAVTWRTVLAAMEMRDAASDPIGGGLTAMAPLADP